MDSIGLGSVKNDIITIIILLVAFIIFSIFIAKRRKNIILGIFSFSILSNFIFYIDRFSPTFITFNLKWLVKFTLYYWPWINLGLLILLIESYIRNKRRKIAV